MDAIQLTDLFDYRFLSALQYAPDGKTAAFVVSNCNQEENGYESRLWLYDGKELRQLTDLGTEKSFIWEDEYHLLFPAVRSQAEKKRRESGEQFTAYYRLDIRGGEALPAFTLPFAATRIEKTNWGYAVLGEIDAGCPEYYRMTESERQGADQQRQAEKNYEVIDELPFWFNDRGMVDKRRTALYTVSGENIRRVTAPLFHVGDMVCDGDDVYFIGVEYDDFQPQIDGIVYHVKGTDGAVEEVLHEPAYSIRNMIMIDGKLWMGATNCLKHGVNENVWLYTLDPAEKQWKVLREESCSMSGSSVGSDCRYGGGKIWQTKDGSLYHIATRGGNAVVLQVTKDGESRPVIAKEGSADMLAISAYADEALVIGLYDNHLQELYAADLQTGELRRISHFNDAAVAGKYVAEPQKMTIESRGYEIEGWVMLPRDYDPAKTYPAVLDIHGGPKTVYGPVFYHEMQAWAGLGYFVFYCNPKGGDGRDNAFMDIRGDYGGTDFNNLMDFTDAVLQAYPAIDSKRVCVTGGSYGGFMTNWVIGHTDRFCCAATQRSISNWLSFRGTSDIGWYFAEDQCGTDFVQDPESMWEHSPVKYASNVKTPTLFIHSDEDYRCPLEQGLQMFTAIRKRGVPARMCLFHGENHELSRSGKPRHRLRRLREITNWFETYAKK